jgi:hypothetical protein
VVCLIHVSFLIRVRVPLFSFLSSLVNKMKSTIAISRFSSCFASFHTPGQVVFCALSDGAIFVLTNVRLLGAPECERSMAASQVLPHTALESEGLSLSFFRGRISTRSGGFFEHFASPRCRTVRRFYFLLPPTRESVKKDPILRENSCENFQVWIWPETVRKSVRKPGRNRSDDLAGQTS